MTEYPIILDPEAVRDLLKGRRTQVRLLGVSPLKDCVAGDRLWVKESCVGGKMAGGEVTSRMSRAEFIVFRDGWRQYRRGVGRDGEVPSGRGVKWTTGVHMPRWATRTTLIVETVRRERLHDVGPGDMVAEGLAGWNWRFWRGRRRAFAASWDAAHATRGERWADNPEVVVLTFRVEAVRADIQR